MSVFRIIGPLIFLFSPFYLSLPLAAKISFNLGLTFPGDVSLAMEMFILTAREEGGGEGERGRYILSHENKRHQRVEQILISRIARRQRVGHAEHFTRDTSSVFFGIIRTPVVPVATVISQLSLCSPLGKVFLLVRETRREQ